MTAKIICDSISEYGIRLISLQLRYQKFIHGEFMTHRVFSRNASSSRAIPVERLIKDVIDDPAIPVYWGKNRPGMQAVEEMVGPQRDTAIENWLYARDAAVNQARLLANLGVHKQLVNRVIEPWCHINVVVTSTEWNNFFALRCHKDAQPEIRVLAEEIRNCLEDSKPTLLNHGQWHLPYVEQSEYAGYPSDQEMYITLVKLSVARCARVSYLTHEGKPPNIEDDLKLYDRLVGSSPLHASPAEHQATPDRRHFNLNLDQNLWEKSNLHGNLRGWIQYRKTLFNEYVA